WRRNATISRTSRRAGWNDRVASAAVLEHFRLKREPPNALPTSTTWIGDRPWRVYAHRAVGRDVDHRDLVRDLVCSHRQLDEQRPRRSHAHDHPPPRFGTAGPARRLRTVESDAARNEISERLQKRDWQ